MDLDVVGAAKLWFRIAPNAPQPKSNHDVLATLHHARTRAQSIPDELRCYSHAWLAERNLPSGLPDHLKPKADRLYPRVVRAVGISVNALSPQNEPLARAIEKAMSDAVLECIADGVTDSDVVKARMDAARLRV